MAVNDGNRAEAAGKHKGHAQLAFARGRHKKMAKFGQRMVAPVKRGGRGVRERREAEEQAVAFALVGPQTFRRERFAWICIFLGVVAWTAGQLFWDVYDIAGIDASPVVCMACSIWMRRRLNSRNTSGGMPTTSPTPLLTGSHSTPSVVVSACRSSACFRSRYSRAATGPACLRTGDL